MGLFFFVVVVILACCCCSSCCWWYCCCCWCGAATDDDDVSDDRVVDEDAVSVSISFVLVFMVQGVGDFGCWCILFILKMLVLFFTVN